MLSITVFVWAIGATFATHLGQDIRAGHRSPVISNSANPAAEIAFALDRLSERSLQFTIEYVIPNDLASTPPPGLPKWPEPGEVYLSPALHAAGKAEGIESRYGTYAGEISTDGLTHPKELFAYVNPTDRTAIANKFEAISGFGSPSPLLIGSLLDRTPIGHPLIAITFLIGIPLMLLTGSAIKMGLYRRREETTILQILGASRAEILRWQAGKISIPLIGWAGVTIVLGAVTSKFGIPLPFVDFRIYGPDLQHFIVPITITALIAVGGYTALWLMASSRSLDMSSSTRPTAIAETYSAKRARIGIVAAPSAVIVAVIGAGQENFPLFLLFIALAAVTFFTLSDIIGSALISLARTIRRQASKRRDPEVLVTAAVAESRSAAITRIAIVMALAIVVGVVLQTILSVFAQADPNSKAIFEKYRDSALTAQINSELSGSELAQFLAKVEESEIPNVLLVSDGIDEETNEPQLKIALLKLENTQLAENDVAQAYLSALAHDIGLTSLNSAQIYSISDFLDTSVNSDPSETAQQSSWTMLFLADTWGTLDTTGIKRFLAHVIAPLPYLEIPEESWLIAQANAMNNVNWVRLFASIGILFTALSILVFTADEQDDALRRLARLNSLSGRPIRVAKISLVRIALPVGVGIAVGVALSTIFSVSLVLLYGEDISLFTSIIPSISAIVIAIFCVVWLLSARNFNSLMKGTS
ncbi:MAG: hypothetical protein Q4E03_02170 [Trueperella sp.]|nr:hypothetical protein [Trueperella sp.]